MSETPMIVACLCAQWCGVCRDYEPLFDAVSRAFEGRAEFAMIDIEEDEEVLGDLDVETFPTLLIARGEQVMFFGSVTPQEGSLRRLVQSALDDGLDAKADPRLAQLADRVRAGRG